MAVEEEENTLEHYVHKPCSLDLALSPLDTGLGLCPQGGVRLERGLWHSPAS